jgi:hypothetical protein
MTRTPEILEAFSEFRVQSQQQLNIYHPGMQHLNFSLLRHFPPARPTPQCKAWMTKVKTNLRKTSLSIDFPWLLTQAFFN